jgi:hypothetical protein
MYLYSLQIKGDSNKSEFIYRNWGKGSFFLTLNQPLITLFFLAYFQSKPKTPVIHRYLNTRASFLSVLNMKGGL